MNADESRVLKIKTFYKKNSTLTSKSGPWDELPAETLSVAAKVVLEEGEIPAVLSVLSDEEWTLLTSRRILWSLNDGMHDLIYKDLAYGEAILRDWGERKKTRLEWGSGMYDGATRIQVTSQKGAKFKIPVEGGGHPLSGFLSVLYRITIEEKKAIMNLESKEAVPPRQ
jgi:hypothetical protein